MNYIYKQLRQMKKDHELRNTITASDIFFMGKPPVQIQFTPNQERELLWEEEKKKRKQWEEDHWVCSDGGNGYFR